MGGRAFRRIERGFKAAPQEGFRAAWFGTTDPTHQGDEAWFVIGATLLGGSIQTREATEHATEQANLVALVQEDRFVVGVFAE